MKLAVIGLSLSSSWGNGHATTYRALLGAFAARGHHVTFLERDQPWYAAHRDLPAPDWCDLVLYDAAVPPMEAVVAADAVIVGSYVADGPEVIAATQRRARGVTAFYDIDTPVTLAKLAAGDHAYLAPANVPGFDLYLSFTGGPTLTRLETRWGARRAEALYCSVDPALYPPLDVAPRWALGYLGTYSEDRQPALDALLLAPARARPDLAFAVAGPLYPDGIDWPANVTRIEHLSPPEHARFYAECALTLNITRASMKAAGWSPSVRLFEAAACARPILSDRWPGLDVLFVPDREILMADGTADALAALERADLAAIGQAARARVLAVHTAAHRAVELEHFLLSAADRPREETRPAHAHA